MLGILKCGAAYLPVEGSNPVSRNLQCLQDAKAKYLISDSQCNKLLSDRRIVISTDKGSDFHGQLDIFDSYNSEPDDKAYIMYTSGSTGKQKGVIVPHRAVIRLVIDCNYISIKKSDCFLQFSSPSFDASTFEFWGALLNGAVLAMYSGTALDPNILKKDIRYYNVSILWLTAALFHLVADKCIELLSPIRVLLAGGDVLNPKYINKVLDTFPNVKIVNGYGPTENTTFTCCHVMTTENRPTNTTPIGKPISGTKIHILDDALNPIQNGEVGELYTSGSGVALGYINDDSPEDAFFTNGNISSGLIYRTGDLVKKNDNGELEFIGRIDNQVKIRGYRASLDEIRARLVELDLIYDAVVVVDKLEFGDQLLIAYLQVPGEGGFDIKQLKNQLSDVLPSYLIPDRFIKYEVFPITDNGKVNYELIASGKYQEG